ncbi:MAG: hypothetical protein ACOCZP_01335 [Candidatus Hadarchaeota archaeon]
MMEEGISTALVVIVLSVCIVSAGALMFFAAGNDGNPENLEKRFQDFKKEYEEFRDYFSEHGENLSDRVENLRSVWERVENLESRLNELRNLLENIDKVENDDNDNTPERAIYEFSFENDMEEWTSMGADLDNPPIEWGIERSQEYSVDGQYSLKYELANMNDAGKIWIERSFDVEPEKTYRVDVSYDLASRDYGVNLWTIITGAYPDIPLKENDSTQKLIFQGDTGTGSESVENHEWLDKSYDFLVDSGENGKIHVNIGIWGTWEATRTYYLDNLRIEFEPLSDESVDERFEEKVFDSFSTPVVENGLVPDVENMDRRNFVDLYTSENCFTQFNFSEVSEEVENFVRSTDFEESYLLVFQEFPASTVPDYKVTGFSRTEDTVNLFIDDDSPAGTDDITLETLLVRMKFGDGDPFKNVKVVLGDGRIFGASRARSLP